MKKLILVVAAVILVMGMLSIPLALGAESTRPNEIVGQRIDTIIGIENSQYLSTSSYLQFTGKTPTLLDILESQQKEALPNSVQAAGGAAAALIPYRSPAANFSRNTLISRDYGLLTYQTEPHISVNPNDPNHLVVGMIDYNFPGVVTYTSFDGGVTWQGPFQPKIPQGMISGAGDPVTAFDREGNVYICQMAYSYEKFEVGGIYGYAAVASIVVSKSTDGGLTWQYAQIASPGEVYGFDYDVPEGEKPRGEVYSYFVDKPWMTIGPSNTDPSKDVIYLTYTLFIEVYTLSYLDEVAALTVAEEVAVIELVRSDDLNNSWTYPVAVSPYVFTAGRGGEADRLVHGSQPMVTSNGTLHVAYLDTWTDGSWEGDAEIWVATSTNKGQTFTRRVAAHFKEMDYYPRSSSFRSWATMFPQTAVSPNDEIYIAYTAYPSSNTTDAGDVFVVSSTNNGTTYSLPAKVNDDITDNMQFFPSIDVGSDGRVHLMWGDFRDDPSEVSFNIYYSVSSDNGKTWQLNSRVTDYPSNPNKAFPYGAFIGDYFSLAVSSTDVYMVWADSRLGEVTGYNQKIGFARQRAMPAPQLFLSPPSGTAGRDIIIQGSYFQPDTEIFISMGGVLLSTGLTDAVGNFMQTIYAPISGEGAREVVVADISGNVGVASFFTEFGFDTFQKGLNDLTEQIAGLNTTDGTDGTTNSDDWLVPTLIGVLVIAVMVVLALAYRMKTQSRRDND